MNEPPADMRDLYPFLYRAEADLGAVQIQSRPPLECPAPLQEV